MTSVPIPVTSPLLEPMPAPMKIVSARLVPGSRPMRASLLVQIGFGADNITVQVRSCDLEPSLLVPGSEYAAASSAVRSVVGAPGTARRQRFRQAVIEYLWKPYRGPIAEWEWESWLEKYGAL